MINCNSEFSADQEIIPSSERLFLNLFGRSFLQYNVVLLRLKQEKPQEAEVYSKQVNTITGRPYHASNSLNPYFKCMLSKRPFPIAQDTHVLYIRTFELFVGFNSGIIHFCRHLTHVFFKLLWTLFDCEVGYKSTHRRMKWRRRHRSLGGDIFDLNHKRQPLTFIF